MRQIGYAIEFIRTDGKPYKNRYFAEVFTGNKQRVKEEAECARDLHNNMGGRCRLVEVFVK